MPIGNNETRCIVCLNSYPFPSAKNAQQAVPPKEKRRVPLRPVSDPRLTPSTPCCFRHQKLESILSSESPCSASMLLMSIVMSFCPTMTAQALLGFSNPLALRKACWTYS